MMILRRMEDINRNQKGFTLVEMLVAIAITAIIGLAATTATYQVVRINSSSTNRQIAITQVENTVNDMSRNTQQAQNTIPKDITGIALPVDAISKEITFNLIAGDKLTLKWVAWNNSKNEVTYNWLNGALQKTITIITFTNGVPTTNTSTVLVANNISDASGTWNTDKKVLSIHIQATVGTGTSLTHEARTFQIIPRPAQ